MEFLNLKCDFCGDYSLYYHPLETFNGYKQSDFEIVDIKNIINNSNNDYLIFKCRICGASIKYTFKEIEKDIKDNMCELIINSIAIEQYKDMLNVVFARNFFVYCGKCKGWDGKGSCPIEIFEKCELKRMPI